MQPERHIFVVDDDPDARDSLTALLLASGYAAQPFASATDFMSRGGYKLSGCVIADIRMPQIDGLKLLEQLVERGATLSVIFVTGHADVPLAVRAMKAGAIDFLEKPFDEGALLASVARAFETVHTVSASDADKSAEERFVLLTNRERQVLEEIVDGNANKIIAFHLSISPRTVELHRARVMDKMRARSVAELVRMALPLLQARRTGPGQAA